MHAELELELVVVKASRFLGDGAAGLIMSQPCKQLALAAGIP